MKLFKRIFVILIILITILIYYKFENKKINYVAINITEKENYSDYLGDRSHADETMSRPYDYDFDQTTEYLYPAPFLAGDTRQIEFISNGNFVTVPSSFITRIVVRMEGIYEE